MKLQVNAEEWPIDGVFRISRGAVTSVETLVVEILDDEWTAVTADGSVSAHFEHTILVTEEGPEVLTRVEGSH